MINKSKIICLLDCGNIGKLINARKKAEQPRFSSTSVLSVRGKKIGEKLLKSQYRMRNCGGKGRDL